MKKNELTRREFTKQVAAFGAILGAGSLAIPGCAKKVEIIETPISIQLYTVRDLLRDDFAGTLRQVAAVGYKGFEFAGFGDLTAKQIVDLMNELGVVCSGTHTGFGDLNDKLQESIDFNLGIGNKNIICPYMPNEFQDQKIDGYKAFAEKLNTFGEAIKNAGMQLYYHNHAFEFEMVDGKYLYDYLLEAMPADLVKIEADLFWVKKAGIEPVDFIAKYGSRCDLLHMKDMTNDEEQTFAPVGTGTVDFPAIIKAGRANNVQWFVVEQDRTVGSPIDAITTSYANLRALLNA